MSTSTSTPLPLYKHARPIRLVDPEDFGAVWRDLGGPDSAWLGFDTEGYKIVQLIQITIESATIMVQFRHQASEWPFSARRRKANVIL